MWALQLLQLDGLDDQQREGERAASHSRAATDPSSTAAGRASSREGQGAGAAAALSRGIERPGRGQAGARAGFDFARAAAKARGGSRLSTYVKASLRAGLSIEASRGFEV
jgi:hypothetical protein